MDYDFSISENVSLSKILDGFIIDNKNPEVIINFLKMHDADFKDIIANSFYWNRIFQLDFVFECNDACIDYIVSKLPTLNSRLAMYLVWQICKPETQLPKLTKDKVRTFAFIHLSRANDDLRSPYAYSTGKYIEKAYDIRFFEACNRRCLVEEMCSMTDNDLKNYCDNIDGSLFKDRFLQYDVFSCLSDIQKSILLRSIKDDGIFTTSTNYHFITQILESDEIPEVKYEAVNVWSKYDVSTLKDNDYAKCSSFSELLLMMSIEGIYDYHNVIQQLLDFNRLDVLKDWIEYDEAGFNEAYNISGLVKYMLKLKHQKAA